MRLVKVLIVLVLTVGVIYLAVSLSGGSGDGASKTADDESEKAGVRLEEKYGFTSEQALP